MGCPIEMGPIHLLTGSEPQLTINKEGNKLMKMNHKYIGLDVHKEQNQVAIARELVGFIWAIAREATIVLTPVHWLLKLAWFLKPFTLL